jgi:hypothetical protein
MLTCSHHAEWLEYLITHFLDPWGYRLTGQARWFGDEHKDRGLITVADNIVSSCYRDDELRGRPSPTTTGGP